MFVKIFTLTLLVFLSFDLNEAQSNLNRCDGVPDNQFLRDYTNCQGYIICIDNQPVNGLCPHGFYFEENGQTCDFSHEVPCIVCDPNGVYNTALANSCEQYILCYNGTGSIHNCAEGLSFSPENGICIKDEFNDCIDGLCPAIILDNVVLNIPSRQGCNVFYRCTNSGNTTMHCPPGLQFNSVSNRCDLISNVVCEVSASIKIEYITKLIISPPIEW